MQTFDDSQLRQILLRRRKAAKQRLGAFQLSTGRAAAVVTATQSTQRRQLQDSKLQGGAQVAVWEEGWDAWDHSNHQFLGINSPCSC